MNRNIFFRQNRQKEPETPQTLKIDGVGEAPMTMEADNAELAAQALLEVMLDKQKRRRKKSDVSDKSETSEKSGESGKPNTLQTSEYYHQLSDRIRKAYASSRQRTLRFLCYCEQQLRNQDIPLYGADSLNIMQAELLKRIDVVDRVGGEIKARWQHCLAEVTLRQIEASVRSDDEDEEGKEE